MENPFNFNTEYGTISTDEKVTMAFSRYESIRSGYELAVREARLSHVKSELMRVKLEELGYLLMWTDLPEDRGYTIITKEEYEQSQTTKNK